MTTYFNAASFKFLRSLARNNDRDWFHAHKADYETHVRGPFQRLLTDLQPVVAEVSPHFRADPKAIGGSLFRIQRDTRFAHDKSPYKSWQGARVFHERRREVEAPSFYLHLQGGNCFVGAGLWHPGSDTVRGGIPAGRIVEDEVPHPAHGVGSRMPRGFPPEFEFADDLRRKNFVAIRALDDAVMTGPGLLKTLRTDLSTLAPFVDYLCAALDLEF